MGISGLLPLLHEASQPKHLRDYAGQTLAVDAFVLLHRGLVACAQEVATGKKTLKYVSYAMSRIHMLQHFGITPYVVFDGANLPSKQHTEADRAARRAEAFSSAQALLASGQTSAARDHFLKACDVTPQMAYQMIKQLQRHNIQYVVAPYEADAQMCYLEKEGLVDGLLTEDSDLLVFGCSTVLYKWNKEGSVVELKKERLVQCKDFRLDGWSQQDFRHMAILSGCDYLANIPGVGCKTAHLLMRRYRDPKKVIQALRLDAKYTVPRNYHKEFDRADSTFQHQCVYDPRSQTVVHLQMLPASGLSTDHLIAVGAGLTNQLCHGIAIGALDPTSKEAMIDIHPDEPQASTSRVTQDTSIGATKKKDAALPGTKDIRNFFRPKAAAAEPTQTRQPLSTKPPNSPSKSSAFPRSHSAASLKGKEKQKRKSAPQSPEQKAASKFFGGGPSVKSIASTMDVEEGEDDDVELVTDSQKSPLSEEVVMQDVKPNVQQLHDVIGHDEDGVAGPAHQQMPMPAEAVALAPIQPSSPALVDSESGHITSPGASSPPQMLDQTVWSKSEPSEGDNTLGSNADFKFSSPAKDAPSSPGGTSPILEQPPARGKPNDVARSRAQVDEHATSDISDFPESPATVLSPPSKKRKAKQTHGSPLRAPKVTKIEIGSDEVEEQAQSEIAAQSIAARWRSRFSFSAVSAGSSSSPGPSGSARKMTGLGQAVRQTVTSKPVRAQPLAAAKPSAPPRKRNAQGQQDEAGSITSRNSRPSQKVADFESEATTDAEEQPKNWKKVDISCSRLLAFRR